MKNLSLKLMGVCLVFFAGIAVANAQAVQAAEPASNLTQDWDAQAQKQNQQDLANQNSGNDDMKFQNWQDQKANAANGADDATNDATLQGADEAQAIADAAAAVDSELAEEMSANGFLAIPGFTYTGDHTIDAPAYQAAYEVLMNDETLQLQLFNDDPATYEKL